MAELSHFLFNSDYPTDKIVYMHEGQIALTTSLNWQYDFVNTHIPIQLYTEGDFKISGSDDVYPLGDNDSSSGLTTVGSFLYQGECWIIVQVAPFSSAVGKTMSYRIWSYCDEETAKNTDIKTTTDVAKPRLALTSDNSYPRFLGDGYITQGQSYTHNLGFIPIVKTWSLFENISITMPDGTTTSIDPYEPLGYPYFGDVISTDGWSDSIIHITDNKITTYPHTPSDPDEPVPSKLYFRMYRI